jgi:hypothetical protein
MGVGVIIGGRGWLRLVFRRALYQVGLYLGLFEFVILRILF